MKPVMVWCVVSATLLLVALFIHDQPAKDQGLLIMGALAIAALLFMVRVCKG